MGLCIYCLQDSSSSQHRAHIVPESFLKNDVTLELGTECDECNNFASSLEKAFVYHNRIWTQIMVLRAPGKNGKKRKGMAHYTADDNAEVLTIRYQPRWVVGTAGEQRISFPDPKEYSDSKFRRCLGHISLNYIAWKLGWDVALESRFDELRNYVRYSSREKRWPYGQVSHDDSQPRRKLGIGLASDAPGLTIRLESYIDDFYFDPLQSSELADWIDRCNGQQIFYHQGST
jgi:hypothetical protein